MRLARLVAAGLALGVVAGFAVALLRPRPQNRPHAGLDAGDPASHPAVLLEAAERGGSHPLIDVRSRRPVTG